MLSWHSKESDPRLADCGLGSSLPGRLVAREDIMSGKVLRAEEQRRGPEMLRREKVSIFRRRWQAQLLPWRQWIVQKVNILNTLTSQVI